MNLKDFIVPAVDIREGRVVRLLRGEFKSAKAYPFTPRELAHLFGEAGFGRLHVVDLDGAEEGKPKNLSSIREVRSAFPGTIEVGGGIRSFEVAKALIEEGIDYVVVGTVAIDNPAEFERMLEAFQGRIILSIDAREGKVAVGGWKRKSNISPEDMVRANDSKPIWGYLYTVVERDGSLEGVSVEPYRRIKSLTSKNLLASGGVSSLADVKKLLGVADGVVVGKALYEGLIPIGDIC